MLTINVGATDAWDEAEQVFTSLGGVEVQFEHSLVSLSKWESMYEKPFLGPDEKTAEETLGYVKLMCLSRDIDPNIWDRLSPENLKEINEYINRKMTATWFQNVPGPTIRAKEVITAEIIYYWLIALNIPWETQYWHLERLLTLVRVCNEKTQPPKKLSRSEIAARQRKLNAERKTKLNTTG